VITIVIIFSARWNIYIPRLYYYASVRLSVRLSVCDVCALWSQGAMDLGYLCMLGWMDVFATYWQLVTQIVGLDDAGIYGGSGGYGKIGNCSDITYFIYWESGPETRDTSIYVYINDMLTFCNGLCNLGRKCIISEERFLLELPTSCAMLATARPLVNIPIVVTFAFYGIFRWIWITSSLSYTGCSRFRLQSWILVRDY